MVVLGHFGALHANMRAHGSAYWYSALGLGVLRSLWGLRLSFQHRSSTMPSPWAAGASESLAAIQPTVDVSQTPVSGLFCCAMCQIVVFARQTPVFELLHFQVLHMEPQPVLVATAIMSNIGGAATGVGDPPNIIVLNYSGVVEAGVGFAEFSLHCAIGAILASFVALLQMKLMYRPWLRKVKAKAERISTQKSKDGVLHGNVGLRGWVGLEIPPPPNPTQWLDKPPPIHARRIPSSKAKHVCTPGGMLNQP